MAIRKREPIKIGWLNTANNPRASPWAEPVSWSLHAIIGCDDATPVASLRRQPAACGLRARHGWALDLFIDRECLQCVRALIRDGICPDDVRERFNEQIKLIASFREGSIHSGD